MWGASKNVTVPCPRIWPTRSREALMSSPESGILDNIKFGQDGLIVVKVQSYTLNYFLSSLGGNQGVPRRA